MKERPILFSTSMVQAILDGRKTMTRRTKGLEQVSIIPFNWGLDKTPYQKDGRFYYEIQTKVDDSQRYEIKFPYGQVGDILYVRETFYAWGSWVKNGFTKSGKQKYKFIDITLRSRHVYQYEGFTSDEIKSRKDDGIGWYKRPSLFMPREACRLFLEITDRRVERLLDITQEDAINEGVEYSPEIGYKLYTDKGDFFSKHLSPADSFMSLWQKINGLESCKSNPCVWVIEFKRIDK